MAKRKPPPTIPEMKDMLWKDYMKTRHWYHFRKTFDTDDAICAICGKKKWEFYKKTGLRKKKPTCQFQTHHLNYDALGEETPDDVLYLCKTCHGLAHDLEMASRTRKGIYTILYDLFCRSTPWEYIPFKDRKR